MSELTLTVPNIMCAGCVRAIQGELTELAGVQSVSGDEATRLVRVAFEAPATQDGIESALREINYPPESA